MLIHVLTFSRTTINFYSAGNIFYFGMHIKNLQTVQMLCNQTPQWRSW